MSIPLKLLAEAETHNVTIELKGGEVYRGTLESSEDSMNCQLSNVTHTARDGRVTKMSAVYIRGSQVRLVVVPNILKNAPIFATVADVGSKAQKKAAAARRKGSKKKGADVNLYQQRAAEKLGR
jgi:small nuclear ribonucleoprotein D3